MRIVLVPTQLSPSVLPDINPVCSRYPGNRRINEIFLLVNFNWKILVSPPQRIWHATQGRKSVISVCVGWESESYWAGLQRAGSSWAETERAETEEERERKGGWGRGIHSAILFFFFLTTAFQTYPDRTNFRNIKHLYIFWSNCFGEQSLTIH